MLKGEVTAKQARLEAERKIEVVEVTFFFKIFLTRIKCSYSDDQNMTKISQDEAERKCANLRLESLHRHNDHEVFLITVIVTPLSKFYLFICCHFHCHRYRNHQGHRQSYLHCHRGQVLLGKLQAVVESHSKCLKNIEKVRYAIV